MVWTGKTNLENMKLEEPETPENLLVIRYLKQLVLTSGVTGRSAAGIHRK